MKTKAQGNELVAVTGHVGVQGGNDSPIVTEKAWRVTFDTVEGLDVACAESHWVPKSIVVGDGMVTQRDKNGVWYEFKGMVPAWFLRKLDTRPEWQRRGYARPPSPVRV